MEPVDESEDHVSPVAVVQSLLECADVKRAVVDLTGLGNGKGSDGVWKEVRTPTRCAFKSHWGELCREHSGPLYWCRRLYTRQALMKAARDRAWVVMLVPVVSAWDIRDKGGCWVATRKRPWAGG